MLLQVVGSEAPAFVLEVPQRALEARGIRAPPLLAVLEDQKGGGVRHHMLGSYVFKHSRRRLGLTQNAAAAAAA